MQFGRIYGIGLIVLGIILCLLQFVRYAAQPKTDANPAHTKGKSAPVVSSFPGIVGAGSLVAGIALFVTARRRDQPARKYEVK